MPLKNLIVKSVNKNSLTLSFEDLFFQRLEEIFPQRILFQKPINIKEINLFCNRYFRTSKEDTKRVLEYLSSKKLIKITRNGILVKRGNGL